MDDTEMELPVETPAVRQGDAATTEAPAAPVAKKFCCKCGKDVTGHRRAKDEHGYWCYDCHKADMAKRGITKKPKARCPQCGRMVPADTLTLYHGHSACAKCISEQEDLPRHQQLKFKRKMDDSQQTQYEKYRVLVLFGVLVLLGIVILLNHFKIL
jgi:hypothetical protein